MPAFAPKTVLLVEDDPLLRHDLKEALTGQGFAVREAGSAPEALDIIRESGRSIGWLITDYQLGAISGVHVAFEFRFQNPLRPIVFITAHDLPGDMRRMSGVMYLRKPFSRDDLFAALGSLCCNGSQTEPARPGAGLGLAKVAADTAHGSRA